MMGFQPEVIGERQQLRMNYRVYKTLYTSYHANWANLPIIRSICYKREDSKDIFYGIGNKYISRHYEISPESISYGAIIHAINDDGSSDYCAFPDIINTQTGNMLYTSEQNLGKAYYGTHVNSGSEETNKIIDNAGRDLSALNGKTVINLKDGSTATITSVTTTTATNDTLNFTGGFSDAGSILPDDEWVVFVDTFKDLNTLSYPHFSNQPAYSEWSRQLLDFDGVYYVGNGNYIAKLSNDESTWDEDFTKLPSNVQFRAMARNANQILVGGDLSGSGALMLWDGATQNTYTNILPVPNTVYSVQPYGSGWIVFAGSTLYLTDGYSLKKLPNGELPDSEGDYKVNAGPYSMLIEDDTVILNTGVGSTKRNKTGVWIYSLINGYWIFSPFENSSGKKVYYSSSSGSVLKTTSSSYNSFFVSYGAGTDNHLARFLKRGSGVRKGMAILSYNAKQKTMINAVELILGQAMGQNGFAAPNFKAIVAIADGNRLFWEYGSVKTNSAAYNTITVNGSSTTNNRAEVGDFILILNGNASGEYAFITDISGAGTATEVWTLDRDLTGYPSADDYFNVLPFKNIGEYAVNSDTFKNPYLFGKAREVDGDFYVMVIIDATVGDIDIRNLAIY